MAAHAWADTPEQAATLHASAEAALSLAVAGMWTEAERAYAQALSLAETLGQWLQLVKMHRELAQIAVRDGQPTGPDRALRHIQEALTAGERAFTGVGEGLAGEQHPPAGPNRELLRTQGVTCHEAARALAHAGRFEEALAWLDRAIGDLEADEATIDELAGAVHLAASLEGTKLGRPAQARERLQATAERCHRLGKENLAEGLTQLSSKLH
jgi:tetratricopeptide (TPR) repeat protein